ncbi:MAG: MFS transporter [Candidatus Taylorbacteria bacterium]|nr:MFS transporter [Candidatus Taylorbacteria bacterium]
MVTEIGEKRSTKIFALYVIGFLFTLHGALPAYITSSFLNTFINEHFIGALYALSALVTILFFILIPKIIYRFGNYLTTQTLLLCDIAGLIGLIWSHNPYVLSISFIVSFTAIAVIGFNIDVFLEHFSKDAITGKIRGILLSTSNIAWVVAPLLGGLILTNGDYWKIFLTATLIVLPLFFVLHSNFRDFGDPDYQSLPIKNTLKEMWVNKSIRSVFIVSFLLQFFYSWMIIYSSLYLYTYVGFSWKEIGVMFSIMLLPFVLIEAPLGRLADTKWGEKEVMAVGFIVMAVPTAMVAFVHAKSFFLWTSLMFVSRVGASMVEIMSETYFFKKIDSTRTNILGLFRAMRPSAYLVSPVVATILFSFGFSIPHIFIVLSLIMLMGIHWSLSIEDTL